MHKAGVPIAPTAAQEWRVNWLLVVSAMAGVSLGTIPSATLGLFMAPLQDEFGWSRTEISAGLTLFAIVSLPLTPFAGMLVDKFGARRVAIPGIALSALVFASFSSLGAFAGQWLVLWFAYTLVSLLTRTLVWNSAISRAFVTSRGLAIAVLLCGTAIASSLSPIVSQQLIDQFGWRFAYLGLGLGWGGVALLMVLLFFRERPPMLVPGAGQGALQGAAAKPGGLSLKQAMRDPAMVRIALAIFLQSTMVVAVMVHLVPMLTATGLSRVEAAGLAGLMGIASICGKLASGWLIDRFTGGLLAALTFAAPALGYLFLLKAADTAWLIPVAVVVLGYSSGACLQLATYLTTRYAGLRNFGAIFGVISSLMALSTGLGPLMAGFIFDRTGSYTLLLTIGIPAALVAGIAVFRLGPYPVFEDMPDKS